MLEQRGPADILELARARILYIIIIFTAFLIMFFIVFIMFFMWMLDCSRVRRHE